MSKIRAFSAVSSHICEQMLVIWNWYQPQQATHTQLIPAQHIHVESKKKTREKTTAFPLPKSPWQTWQQNWDHHLMKYPIVEGKITTYLKPRKRPKNVASSFQFTFQWEQMNPPPQQKTDCVSWQISFPLVNKNTCFTNHQPAPLHYFCFSSGKRKG